MRPVFTSLSLLNESFLGEASREEKLRAFKLEFLGELRQLLEKAKNPSEASGVMFAFYHLLIKYPVFITRISSAELHDAMHPGGSESKIIFDLSVVDEELKESLFSLSLKFKHYELSYAFLMSQLLQYKSHCKSAEPVSEMLVFLERADERKMTWFGRALALTDAIYQSMNNKAEITEGEPRYIRLQLILKTTREHFKNILLVYVANGKTNSKSEHELLSGEIIRLTEESIPFGALYLIYGATTVEMVKTSILHLFESDALSLAKIFGDDKPVKSPEDVFKRAVSLQSRPMLEELMGCLSAKRFNELFRAEFKLRVDAADAISLDFMLSLLDRKQFLSIFIEERVYAENNLFEYCLQKIDEPKRKMGGGVGSPLEKDLRPIIAHLLNFLGGMHFQIKHLRDLCSSERLTSLSEAAVKLRRGLNQFFLLLLPALNLHHYLSHRATSEELDVIYKKLADLKASPEQLVRRFWQSYLYFKLCGYRADGFDSIVIFFEEFLKRLMQSKKHVGLYELLKKELTEQVYFGFSEVKYSLKYIFTSARLQSDAIALEEAKEVAASLELDPKSQFLRDFSSILKGGFSSEKFLVIVDKKLKSTGLIYVKLNYLVDILIGSKGHALLKKTDLGQIIFEFLFINSAISTQLLTGFPKGRTVESPILETLKKLIENKEHCDDFDYTAWLKTIEFDEKNSSDFLLLYLFLVVVSKESKDFQLVLFLTRRILRACAISYSTMSELLPSFGVLLDVAAKNQFFEKVETNGLRQLLTNRVLSEELTLELETFSAVSTESVANMSADATLSETEATGGAGDKTVRKPKKKAVKQGAAKALIASLLDTEAPAQPALPSLMAAAEERLAPDPLTISSGLLMTEKAALTEGKPLVSRSSPLHAPSSTEKKKQGPAGRDLVVAAAAGGSPVFDKPANGGAGVDPTVPLPISPASHATQTSPLGSVSVGSESSVSELSLSGDLEEVVVASAAKTKTLTFLEKRFLRLQLLRSEIHKQLEQLKLELPKYLKAGEGDLLARLDLAIDKNIDQLKILRADLKKIKELKASNSVRESSDGRYLPIPLELMPHAEGCNAALTEMISILTEMIESEDCPIMTKISLKLYQANIRKLKLPIASENWRAQWLIINCINSYKESLIVFIEDFSVCYGEFLSFSLLPLTSFSAESLTDHFKKFWVLLHTVKQYLHSVNCLEVVSDITADDEALALPPLKPLSRGGMEAANFLVLLEDFVRRFNLSMNEMAVKLSTESATMDLDSGFKRIISELSAHLCSCYFQVFSLPIVDQLAAVLAPYGRLYVVGSQLAYEHALDIDCQFSWKNPAADEAEIKARITDVLTREGFSFADPEKLSFANIIPVHIAARGCGSRFDDHRAIDLNVHYGPTSYSESYVAQASSRFDPTTGRLSYETHSDASAVLGGICLVRIPTCTDNHRQHVKAITHILKTLVRAWHKAKYQPGSHSLGAVAQSIITGLRSVSGNLFLLKEKDSNLHQALILMIKDHFFHYVPGEIYFYRTQMVLEFCNELGFQLVAKLSAASATSYYLLRRLDHPYACFDFMSVDFDPAKMLWFQPGDDFWLSNQTALNKRERILASKMLHVAAASLFSASAKPLFMSVPAFDGSVEVATTELTEMLLLKHSMGR